PASTAARAFLRVLMGCTAVVARLGAAEAGGGDTKRAARMGPRLPARVRSGARALGGARSACDQRLAQRGTPRPGRRGLRLVDDPAGAGVRTGGRRLRLALAARLGQQDLGVVVELQL